MRNTHTPAGHTTPFSNSNHALHVDQFGDIDLTSDLEVSNASYTLTGTVSRWPDTLEYKLNAGSWTSLAAKNTFSKAITLADGENTILMRVNGGPSQSFTVTKS